MDFTKLNQHTRLWRWIVYSRATTSAIALRPVFPADFLPADLVVGAISVKKNLSAHTSWDRLCPNFWCCNGCNALVQKL